MTERKDTPTVAIVQHPSQFLDLAKGVERACAYIDEAKAMGADLVAFPESWLPGYPGWIFGMAGWDDPVAKSWYEVFLRNSPTIPGPEIDELKKAARRNAVTISMGLTERAAPAAGTAYNSQLLIGEKGDILGVHRKIMPTHAERLVWGLGDADGLRAHETQAGRVGGLICWEHWHPLARHTLHSQDEQIHVSAWPDLSEMHELVTRMYAFEGRCFVLCAAHYLPVNSVPESLHQAYGMSESENAEECFFDGGSGVIGPDGAWLSSPSRNKAEIIYETLDLKRVTQEKHDMDITGHYDRPDLFDLTVRSGARRTVHFD